MSADILLAENSLKRALRIESNSDLVATSHPYVMCTSLPKHWRSNKSLPSQFRVVSLRPIANGTRISVLASNEERPRAELKNPVSVMHNQEARFSDLRFLGRSGRGKSFNITITIETVPPTVAVYARAIKVTVDGPRVPRNKNLPGRMFKQSRDDQRGAFTSAIPSRTKHPPITGHQQPNSRAKLARYNLNKPPNASSSIDKRSNREKRNPLLNASATAFEAGKQNLGDPFKFFHEHLQAFGGHPGDTRFDATSKKSSGTSNSRHQRPTPKHPFDTSSRQFDKTMKSFSSQSSFMHQMPPSLSLPSGSSSSSSASSFSTNKKTASSDHFPPIPPNTSFLSNGNVRPDMFPNSLHPQYLYMMEAYKHLLNTQKSIPGDSESAFHANANNDVINKSCEGIYSPQLHHHQQGSHLESDRSDGKTGFALNDLHDVINSSLHGPLDFRSQVRNPQNCGHLTKQQLFDYQHPPAFAAANEQTFTQPNVDYQPLLTRFYTALGVLLQNLNMNQPSSTPSPVLNQRGENKSLNIVRPDNSKLSSHPTNNFFGIESLLGDQQSGETTTSIATTTTNGHHRDDSSTSPTFVESPSNSTTVVAGKRNDDHDVSNLEGLSVDNFRSSMNADNNNNHIPPIQLAHSFFTQHRSMATL